MGRGPRKGMSPLDRVYREIAVLKKVNNILSDRLPFTNFIIHFKRLSINLLVVEF